MPTSPTIFERGNEARLAGLIRHHLANDSGIRSDRYVNGSSNGHVKTSATPEHTSPTSNSNDLEPMDYRYSTQTKLQHHVEVRSYLTSGSPFKIDTFSIFQSEHNGRYAGARPEVDDDESRDGYPRGRPGGFRPESAPTVLNMSPECSLSGPPSSRTNSELGHNEDMRGHMMHNGDDLSGKNLKFGAKCRNNDGFFPC